MHLSHDLNIYYIKDTKCLGIEDDQMQGCTQTVSPKNGINAMLITTLIQFLLNLVSIGRKFKISNVGNLNIFFYLSIWTYILAHFPEYVLVTYWFENSSNLNTSESL